MSQSAIYFDYAAATPLDERVFTVMEPYLKGKFYNPSSPYAPARQVKQDFEAAKSQLAQQIGAKPSEIIITAGATESINIAIAGVLKTGGHVVTSSIEHTAVLEVTKQYQHTLVKPNEKGIVSAEDVLSSVKPETKLVSLGLANSELGTLQPVRELAGKIKLLRQKRLQEGNKTPLYLHTDASQAASYIDLKVSRLGIDMLTLNAGKIYGPKQVGLLWRASSVKLEPILFGGGQESDMRPGTENVAGAVGLAKALELADNKRHETNDKIRKLRDKLASELSSAFPDLVISGSKKHQLPNYLHVAWPGVDAERLIFNLENQNVLVATGAACAANKNTGSHVLKEIGLKPEVVDGSLRLTLGRHTTESDILRGTKAIIDTVKQEFKV